MTTYVKVKARLTVGLEFFLISSSPLPQDQQEEVLRLLNKWENFSAVLATHKVYILKPVLPNTDLS